MALTAVEEPLSECFSEMTTSLSDIYKPRISLPTSGSWASPDHWLDHGFYFDVDSASADVESTNFLDPEDLQNYDLGSSMGSFYPAIPGPSNVPAPSEAIAELASKRELTCELCNKTFSRRSGLQRHQALHSSPRFSCPVQGCSRTGDRGYWRKDKLIQHQRTRHGPGQRLKKKQATDSCAKVNCEPDSFNTGCITSPNKITPRSLSKNSFKLKGEPEIHKKAAFQGDLADLYEQPKSERTEPLTLLACPFVQRTLLKHTPSCLKSSWPTVHRVKQHLYRRHREIFICRRCNSSFETQNGFDKHIKSYLTCSGSYATIVPGISQEKIYQLKRRSKVAPGLTEEDKWKIVYMIVFPDSDPHNLPSPYRTTSKEPGRTALNAGDMALLNKYEDFISHKLPNLASQSLKSAKHENQELNSDSLMDLVVAVACHSRKHLLSLFQQTMNEESTKV